MWVVLAVQICIPTVGCMPFVPDHEVFSQHPAATEEACHIAAFDTILDEQRRKGYFAPFNVTCAEQGA